MRIICAFLILFCALGARAASSPQVVLLSDPADSASEELATLVQRDMKGQLPVRRIELAADRVSNPIEKGKLVASLEAARVVVTVGAAATAFVGREVEQTPVYFIGTALAPGAMLASPRVSGTLSYSAEDVLGAIPKQWRRELGILYTPGYEPVVRKIRAAAQAAGGSVQERKVSSIKELRAAAQSLLEGSQAIWTLGDPILAKGAGFQYLAEASLAREVPLLGSDPSQVRGGAVLCSQATPDVLAQRASEDVGKLLANVALDDRIRLAPAGGILYYQPALAAKLGLSTQQPQWRRIP